MSGTWAARLLGAIAGHPTTKSADAELEPIEPGAWTEWAREYRRPTGPAGPGAHVAPRDTRGGGDGLEAGRGVHSVPGDRVVALAPGSRGEQDRPGVDAEADVEVQAEARDALQDPQGRPDRSLGVVLVGGRGSEERHHPIAEEPVHVAAVAGDLARQDVVVGEQERPHVLGVERLGAGGEPGQIGEQDRDDPAFLAGCSRGRRPEHRCTAVAEPRAVGVRAAAGRARCHAREHRGGDPPGEGVCALPDSRSRMPTRPDRPHHVEPGPRGPADQAPRSPRGTTATPSARR
jgi:hypothetical protein